MPHCYEQCTIIMIIMQELRHYDNHVRHPKIPHGVQQLKNIEIYIK